MCPEVRNWTIADVKQYMESREEVPGEISEVLEREGMNGLSLLYMTDKDIEKIFEKASMGTKTRFAAFRSPLFCYKKSKF